MKKTLFCLLLTLCMLVGAVPACATEVFATGIADPAGRNDPFGSGILPDSGIPMEGWTEELFEEAEPEVVDPEFVMASAPNVTYSTITVSDNTHGANAIEDAVLYSNRVNRNYGDYTYDRVGTPSATYGIGRTLVRLSGLISLTEYQQLAAEQIVNVTFYAREATAASTQNIELYPVLDTTWEENTVTWNSFGSYTTAVNYGTTAGSGQWSAFDITDLVKAWKNGTYSEDAGFILVNRDETSDCCFCSSEYATHTEYRPYVVVTYELPWIALDYDSVTLQEGSQRTMVAMAFSSNQSISWSSSNTGIATVSASGVVTAVKAGSATITATITVGGVPYTASCDVLVRIADGVYYFQNKNSWNYLTNSGTVTELADVYQDFPPNPDAEPFSDLDKARQMWRVRYLNNGRYSIRPLNIPYMGLHVTGSNVNLYTVGVTDTAAQVATTAQWTIEWNTNGYVVKRNGNASQTLQIQNAATGANASAVAQAYSSTSMNCRWDLVVVSNPPSGLYFCDTDTGEAYGEYSILVKRLLLGDSGNCTSFHLKPISYDPTTITQSFSWLSGNTSIATVQSDGTVTAVAQGSCAIYIRRYLSGSYRYGSYSLVVRAFPDGTYFLKNKQTGKYVDIDCKIMENGRTLHQWRFWSDDSQRWIFTHLGDGSYSIRSANSSDPYYLGVSGDSTSEGARIVLRSGQITNGMKWKIYRTANDGYRIVPWSSSAKAIAIQSDDDSDGIPLLQKAYYNDSDYTDEWDIQELTPTKITLCGIDAPNHDHRTCLSNGVLVINECGQNNIPVWFGEMSGQEFKEELLSSNILLSRSHGITYSANDLIALLLGEVQRDGFFNRRNNRMTGGDQCIETDDDFSNLDMAVFVACSSAIGGIDGSNLITAIVDHGARVAVGFPTSINCSAANLWTETFIEYFFSGSSVNVAVAFANQASRLTGLVYGDGTYTLN